MERAIHAATTTITGCFERFPFAQDAVDPCHATSYTVCTVLPSMPAVTAASSATGCQTFPRSDQNNTFGKFFFLSCITMGARLCDKVRGDRVLDGFINRSDARWRGCRSRP